MIDEGINGSVDATHGQNVSKIDVFKIHLEGDF